MEITMRRIMAWMFSIALILVGSMAFIWFFNPGDMRDRILVSQIVKMRVAPERLDNPKTPKDYGMDYRDVEFVTADNLRLSAWEIHAPQASNKTIIINHPLTTTRFGSLKGLDGVSAEFLPMVKHLHDNGYNVVMYDHRGQGDSDGGLGKTMRGNEAPVGVGVTEWQDVVASLRYVLAHPEFGDDQIAFFSQCMGANATFLAWQKEPELFSSPQIKALVANQPTISYKMTKRLIEFALGFDLVDKVLEAQRETYGIGFAESDKYVSSLTVPVLYAQVEKDKYTYNEEIAQNDIQDIIDATLTEHDVIWIGPDQDIPYGTGQRFDAYTYFNAHPEAMLKFLDKNMK